MGIFSYAKCIYENKAALPFYIGLGTVFAAKAAEAYTGADLSELKSAAATGSMLSFILTGAGINTVKWYHFAKNRIHEEGTLPNSFLRASQKHYCRATGVRVAAKEHGLESLLPKRDSIF